MKRRYGYLAAAAALILGIVLLAPAQDYTEEQRAAELERVEKMADEILPKVAEIIGMEQGGPVKIVVTTKAEVREFLVQLLDEEYPGDELERQGRCYVALGFLPSGYDIRQGLIDLYHEQAGAFYDPRTKAYYSIIDLPKEMKVPVIERVLVAHELTHALQDRVTDMMALQEVAKEDTDAGYANSAAMEGMASVSMMVAVQGVKLEMLNKLGGLMRMSMAAADNDPNMQVFANAPFYMRELLISPYAEGADFVLAYLKANPEAKLVGLFERLPDSSEQILHYDKYAEIDKPTKIDLSGVDGVLPEGWQKFYSNTIGEFDIRVLCQMFEQTKENAVEIAAGWDGLRFSGYNNAEDELLVVATSIWDSEADAEEFEAGIAKLYGEIYGEQGFSVGRQGVRVSLIVGSVEAGTLEAVLAALATAPATE